MPSPKANQEYDETENSYDSGSDDEQDENPDGEYDGSDIGDGDEFVGEEEDGYEDDIVMEEEYIEGVQDCLYEDEYNELEENSIDENEEMIEMIEHEKQTEIYIDDDKRTTTKFLTKYEHARILGDRTKMIELGAKPLVKIDEKIQPSSKEIAMMELVEGVLPFIIERRLPNGHIERWKVNELILKRYD